MLGMTRPKGSKNKNGYTHSIASLNQRNKNLDKVGKSNKNFFVVPKDSDGNPLVDNDTLRDLYNSNFKDFVCDPANALVKLGSKLSTLLDIQQMQDAGKGKVLSNELLRGVKLTNELVANLHKLKFGDHVNVTVQKKGVDFLDSDEVIDISSLEKEGVKDGEREGNSS